MKFGSTAERGSQLATGSAVSVPAGPPARRQALCGASSSADAGFRSVLSRAVGHLGPSGRFLVGGLLVALVEVACFARMSAVPTSFAQQALLLLAALPVGLAYLALALRHSPRRVKLQFAVWLSGVSVVSCGLAAVLAGMSGGSAAGYVAWRLVLAVLACSLVGFRIAARSRQLGVAMYATPSEDVVGIRRKVGGHLDHIHVDLVDATVNAAAEAVDLRRLAEARRCWPGRPVCLHVMSQRPRDWVERTWEQVDWYLLPCDSQDDLGMLIADCRSHGKRMGIVWQHGASVEQITPFLPQVDFVMVMGIARLGESGQTLCEASLKAADAFDRLRSRYPFELMFDGGVSTQNAARIPGRYLVSASGVLASPAPKASAEALRWSQFSATGGRRAA